MGRRLVLAGGAAALVAYACGQLVAVGPPPGDAGADGAAPDDAGGTATTAGDGGAPDCAPRTCGDYDAACGAVPNGCGDDVPDCGTCPVGASCGGGGPNQCGTAPCTPATTCEAGVCGTISDGCEGTLSCGPCAGVASCDPKTNRCEACSLFASPCVHDSTSQCPVAVPNGSSYVCAAKPDDHACVYCPNPTTGKGEIYCCPP